MKRSFAAVCAAAVLATVSSAGCANDRVSAIPFEMVDLNGDGYIVFDEYYTFLSTRAEAVPPFDLAQAWNAADDNHDGVITHQEHWARLFPNNIVYRLRSYY